MSLGFNPLPKERDSRSELERERDAWRELAELQADFLIDTAAHGTIALRAARQKLVALGQDVSRV